MREDSTGRLHVTMIFSSISWIITFEPESSRPFFLAALECPKKLHKTFTFQMERLETEKHPANLVREG